MRYSYMVCKVGNCSVHDSRSLIPYLTNCILIYAVRLINMGLVSFVPSIMHVSLCCKDYH